MNSEGMSFYPREQITNQIFKQIVRYMLNDVGLAKEDVVWLPVDSTNSGIQIAAVAPESTRRDS